MNIEDLFSPKALNQLSSWANQSKPNNKHYTKLRKQIKDFEIISWLGGTKPIYRTTCDFVEEFISCSDFMAVGHSVHKYINGLYLHRISVLPKGNTRRSYYAFVTEYNAKLIDKVLENS